MAYTSGNPISYNGWTVTIVGTPAAGDTFTIDPNTGGVGDNRNMLLLAELQTSDTLDSRAVERSYAEEGKILSEHALLDDAGGLARATYLESDRTRFATNIPADELERLLVERDELEARIATLIAGKPRLDPLVYDERLESLLVQYALVHRALRPAEAVQ